MQLNIEIEVQGCEQADINVANQCETLTLEIIDAPVAPSGSIDDAAGLGDTGVTWSADKSSRELADKVDKVAGMGLSELSFTADDKNSLDQSEQDRHTHANKSVIDDLSDNAGALEYCGLPVSDQAALDAKVDKVAGYSLVADDEIAKLSTVEQIAQDAAQQAAESVKPYVDSALSDLSTAANKFYPTLALANADIANILVNQPIHVGEAVNGGLWYKATSGATALIKSAYDPLTLSKAYTDNKDKSIMVSDIKGEADVTGKVVYGEYYKSNGAIDTYANTLRTAKIKLDSITDIWVTRNLRGLDGLSIVFFNSSSAFISAHVAIPNDVQTKLTIPTGAVYVGVSGSSLSPFSVVRKSSVDGATIAGMQDGFESISAAVKETAIPIDNNGYYWSATGLLTGSASFKASAKTPIPSNSLLVINGDFDMRAGGQVLFFNSSGALVPSDFVKKPSYDNYLLTPPVTATHVAISTEVTFNTSATLKGDILVGFGDINSTYTAVKSGVYGNAKTVRANNFYDLGSNYAAIKAQRARSNYGILFAGQSNMVGMAAHSQLSTLGLPETLDINNWNGNTFDASQTLDSSKTWGVWWSLLKRLKEAKPSTPIYSYKLAAGGSTLHGDWNPQNFSGLFNSFMLNIDKIKTLDLVNIKVCVWWQGESDSASPHAENYEQRLKDFINAVRGAANDPLLPFVVLGVHKNTGSWYSPVVRAAQIRASIDMPNVYFVDVDDVSYTTAVGQGSHYDGVFFEAVAPRVFDIIKDL